jgi:hypothetical protein
VRSVPELKYRFPDARQIVVVKGLDKDRFTVPCKFCRGKGAIIQCTFPSPKCSFSYHGTLRRLVAAPRCCPPAGLVHASLIDELI